jgi:hypothetical protein
MRHGPAAVENCLDWSDVYIGPVFPDFESIGGRWLASPHTRPIEEVEHVEVGAHTVGRPVIHDPHPLAVAVDLIVGETRVERDLTAGFHENVGESQRTANRKCEENDEEDGRSMKRE